MTADNNVWRSAINTLVDALRADDTVIVIDADLKPSTLGQDDWTWVEQDAGDYGLQFDDAMRRFYGTWESILVRWRFAESPETSVDGSIDVSDVLSGTCMSARVTDDQLDALGPRTPQERELLSETLLIDARTAAGDHWLAFRTVAHDVPQLWVRDPAGAGIDLKLDLDFAALLRHAVGCRGALGWPLLFADWSTVDQQTQQSLLFSVEHLRRILDRSAHVPGMDMYRDSAAALHARLAPAPPPKPQAPSAAARKMPKAEPMSFEPTPEATAEERTAARGAQRWVVRSWPDAENPELLLGADPNNHKNDRLWLRETFDEFVESMKAADVLVFEDAEQLCATFGLGQEGQLVANLLPPLDRFCLAGGRPFKATVQSVTKWILGGAGGTRASLKKHLKAADRPVDFSEYSALYWYAVLHGGVRATSRRTNIIVPHALGLPGDPTARGMLQAALADRTLMRVELDTGQSKVGTVESLDAGRVDLATVTHRDGAWVPAGTESYWIGEFLLVGPATIKELRPWMRGYPWTN